MKRSLIALLTVGVLLTVFVGTGVADHLTVRSSDIVDGTIRAVDIATDAVGSSEIRTGAVGASEIASGAVRASEIAFGAVGSGELSDSLYFALAWDTVRPGETVRGAVGGDFDAHNNLLDWGVIASMPQAARSALSDDEVNINVSGWQNGGGQTQPTTTDTNAGCTGTPSFPTAPAGEVCIYVAGGDNAQGVEGYSVLPGTGASRFGFKLKWENTGTGDTFIDATWAYTAPLG